MKSLKYSFVFTWLIITCCFACRGQRVAQPPTGFSRERISINDAWRFYKYPSKAQADSLNYHLLAPITSNNDSKAADTRPTDAIKDQHQKQKTLKDWILPTANQFINDPGKHFTRPSGNPGSDFPFVQNDFDDAQWEAVNLPHDWAIKGPFMKGANAEVGGGMGRLPSNGVAWYRRKLEIPATDEGKSIFLEIDGAMSYAIVWLNGNLVGGWPYGYNSWQLDLTPYIIPGGVNQLAIRLDNPNHSARWYPGGGLYRNVWLTITNNIRVDYQGTYVTTKNVTSASADINLEVTISNKSSQAASVTVETILYEQDDAGNRSRNGAGRFSTQTIAASKNSKTKVNTNITLKNPKRWGPPPTQHPHMYVAVTSLYQGNVQIDQYETRFGIRSLEFNPDNGFSINGERVQIKGVNQHHDLGALGAAFNTRAAERQLELLREMGCNAIRMAHNPPAPELLELTDRMGFLVFNEIFDSWEQKKTPHDFHLIFPEWYEPDTRNFLRRDRNHPSIIIWGLGNEVGEQYTGEAGAAVAQKIYNIIKEEDLTRPITSAMNFAKPDMALPKVLDIISLNYQGEGIRQDPEFEGTERIRTPPQYDAFHKQFPDKLILSSETASALSSRGVYLFPVSPQVSAPVRDGRGGDSKIKQVSSYELHAVDFGSTAEKVFSAIEQHPFVAGEFVWTGWDYLGEPTPYYDARSSYSGIIDLAGFKKDRYFLYQSHWRPELPMVHMLPHWSWPGREGKITPVHVFTSGDEVELFLNGKSQGRKKKEKYSYRLRWDSLVYEPGVLKAVAYKNDKKWAEQEYTTAGKAHKLQATTDRQTLYADGSDVSFITVTVTDKNGNVLPDSNNKIEFSVTGPGEIIATDNGDPTDMESFSATKRNAFNGKCLVVVRTIRNKPGTVVLTAKSADLTHSAVTIKSVTH